MRPVARPARRFRPSFAALLGLGAAGVTAVLAQPQPPTPSAPPAAADPAKLKAELAAAFKELDAAAREVPADTFDPAAVVELVGRDPDKLFAWVRDQTHYAPYRGALRGPAGVLMDRVGSSLDRGLLLAELLRSAGFEVRLARGSVPATSAAVAAIRPIPADWLAIVRPAAGSTGADASAPGQTQPSAGQPSAARAAAADQAARARTAAHADALLKLVAPAARPVTLSELPDALADHWWVQVKRDGQWVDADPTLPDAKLGAKLAEPTATLPAPAAGAKLAGLPADAVHAVDVKVVVERLEAGKLTEASPLTVTLRPADLQGRRVVFTHVPVAWKTSPSAPAAQQAKALADTTEFVPTLIVGGASTANDAVDDGGRLNQSPDLDRTAGMGKAVGNTLGGFGGGLTGAEPTKDAGVWSAEWLELTVRVPGKPPRTLRREVFDLIGPAARAAAPVAAPKVDAAVRLDRAFALIGETDMLVYGAHPSPQFLASQYAQGMAKTRRQVQATVEARVAAAGKPAGKPGTPTAAPVRLPLDVSKLGLSPLWGVAVGRLAGSPVGADVYLASPNVFCLTTRARASADGSFVTVRRTDLAVNDVAVRPGVDPFAARVRQGVADTVLEAEVVETVTRLTGGPAAGKMVGPAANTANLFDAAGGAGPVVRLPGQPGGDLSAWPADARARAAKAAADGYALVATAKPASAGGQVGWWRVDPATGGTIGVTGDGFHAAMTERAKMEEKINGLLDVPFRLTIDEMKGYTQKEFIEMIVRGKGLSGLQLLRAFQAAVRIHEIVLVL